MADLTQVQLPNGTTYDLRDNTKVAKAGDTMTGRLVFSNVNAIGYAGTQATYDMIRFKDNPNDTYGNGIIVGGGGLTVVGGGEAGNTVANEFSSGGDERLILANDGAIDFYTNCQDGYASATHVTIDSNGNYSGNAATATKATGDESGNNIKATYANSFSISDHTITLKNKNGGSLGTVTVPDNDTKNTAGSTDTSSKIFLIGATSQAANPQTYSQDTAYVGTDGCLYSGGTKVLTSETDPTVPSWAKASSKPSYNFSEIGAGVATIGDGTNRIMLRTNDGYKSGVYYSTPGNEAMIFAHKNPVTSWIFATTDPTTGTSWQSLTPSMQIKNQRVTINKLIANGADASYNLDVNGTINAQTSLTLGGSATLVYNSTTQSVDFTFS